MCAGLDQLCSLDGRFQAYRRTLFGQASLSLDRDAAPPEVAAQLDAALGGFCALLSSYFLLAPAFKALEYLVRKYRRALLSSASSAAAPKLRCHHTHAPPPALLQAAPALL